MVKTQEGKASVISKEYDSCKNIYTLYFIWGMISIPTIFLLYDPQCPPSKALLLVGSSDQQPWPPLSLLDMETLEPRPRLTELESLP